MGRQKVKGVDGCEFVGGSGNHLLAYSLLTNGRVWRSSLVAAVRLTGLSTADGAGEGGAEAVRVADLSGAMLGACCRGKEVLVGLAQHSGFSCRDWYRKRERYSWLRNRVLRLATRSSLYRGGGL